MEEDAVKLGVAYMCIDDYETNDAYMLDKGMLSTNTLRVGTNVYTQLHDSVPINNTIHYKSKLIYDTDTLNTQVYVNSIIFCPLSHALPLLLVPPLPLP